MLRREREMGGGGNERKVQGHCMRKECLVFRIKSANKWNVKVRQQSRGRKEWQESGSDGRTARM